VSDAILAAIRKGAPELRNAEGKLGTDRQAAKKAYKDFRAVAEAELFRLKGQLAERKGARKSFLFDASDAPELQGLEDLSAKIAALEATLTRPEAGSMMAQLAEAAGAVKEPEAAEPPAEEESAEKEAETDEDAEEPVVEAQAEDGKEEEADPNGR
jgi:hypothetical protein